MSDAGDEVELSEEERRTIDAIYERRMTATHYEILGVPRDADRKSIRDAYFALSKRFHPDIFFNRSLGTYRVRIDELFRVFTRAYDVLGNAKQRAGYDLHIGSIESPSRPPPPSVPEVTGIVSAAREVARNAATPEPRRPSMPVAASTASSPPRTSSSPSVPAHGAQASPPSPAAAAVNLPPPARTPPRPVTPPIGTAVMPSAHTQAHSPVAPPPPSAPSKMTPGPMMPLDPETLRRARESMARRLNSVVPQRSSNLPPRGPGAPPTAPPTRLPSQGQIPRVVEQRSSVAQLVTAAEEAQRKGDFAAACESLKQALALSKDDEALRLRYETTRKLLLTQQVDGHINAAREAMRDSQPLVAAKHWEQAAEGRPNDHLLWLNAAEILAKYTKEYKRATDLAQRVTVSDPSNVKAHVVLAGIFIKAGLKASAYASIQTIARLSPDLPALKELREKLGPYTLAEKVGLRGR